MVEYIEVVIVRAEAHNSHICLARFPRNDLLIVEYQWMFRYYLGT